MDKKFDDLTQEICDQAMNYIDFLNAPQEKIENEGPL